MILISIKQQRQQQIYNKKIITKKYINISHFVVFIHLFADFVVVVINGI
jgi:hypothetical protein